MDADLVTLPERFDIPADRLEQMRSAPGGPVAPRDATSVILVRDGADGVEVFLLRRVAEMAFAGGMTVFPGGGASAGDRRPLPTAGPGAAAWAQTWSAGPTDESGPTDAGSTDVATATTLLASAVRETFEETGVLLAGPDVTSLADPSAHTAHRAALVDGSRDLVDVLDAAGLVVRDDLLAPWARWVTPEGMPRRYDTRFFLAVVPDGQEADGRTTEAVEAGWSTPAGAVAAFERGERALLPVTWAVLRDLARQPDTAALVREAQRRRPRPVTPVFVPDGERVRLAVPAHAGAHLAEDPAATGGTA